MSQKTKRVGQWKVGDKVFQPASWKVELGLTGNPTPESNEIIGFSKDKKSAHVRSTTGSFYWVPVEKLQEVGGDLFMASHYFRQAIRIR